MKQLSNKTVIILSTTLLVGCMSTPQVTPSKNSALNNISKSNASKKQSYFFQKKVDKFVDVQWKETVLKDEGIKKKYEENKEKKFTLQEFVDKANVYTKKKSHDSSKSNVSKLESMPVIGK